MDGWVGVILILHWLALTIFNIVLWAVVQCSVVHSTVQYSTLKSSTVQLPDPGMTESVLGSALAVHSVVQDRAVQCCALQASTV